MVAIRTGLRGLDKLQQRNVMHLKSTEAQGKYGTEELLDFCLRLEDPGISVAVFPIITSDHDSRSPESAVSVNPQLYIQFYVVRILACWLH